jgi:hypothetical protein
VPEPQEEPLGEANGLFRLHEASGFAEQETLLCPSGSGADRRCVKVAGEYFVLTYANHTRWSTLILAELFCMIFSVALLLTVSRRSPDEGSAFDVGYLLTFTSPGYSIRVCPCRSSSQDRWLVDASFRSRGAAFVSAGS